MTPDRREPARLTEFLLSRIAEDEAVAHAAVVDDGLIRAATNADRDECSALTRVVGRCTLPTGHDGEHETE